MKRELPGSASAGPDPLHVAEGYGGSGRGPGFRNMGPVKRTGASERRGRLSMQWACNGAPNLLQIWLLQLRCGLLPATTPEHGTLGDALYGSRQLSSTSNQPLHQLRSAEQR